MLTSRGSRLHYALQRKWGSICRRWARVVIPMAQSFLVPSPYKSLALVNEICVFPIDLFLYACSGKYYIKTNTSVVIRKPTTGHVSNRRGFHVQLHGCIFFKLRLVPPAYVLIHHSSLATSSILLILAHPGVAPWRRVSSTHLHNPRGNLSQT